MYEEKDKTKSFETEVLNYSDDHSVQRINFLSQIDYESNVRKGL